MNAATVRKRPVLNEEARGLVNRHLRLVKIIASKISTFLPDHVDREDVIHEGVLGLIDAALKFNPNAGMKFTSYASIRIRGAILDSLRSVDWLPRRLRTLSKTVGKAREYLNQKLKRKPTEEEISAYLDIPVEKLNRVSQAVEKGQMFSFEELKTNSYTGKGAEAAAYSIGNGKTRDEFERVENLQVLKQAISELGEREKLILSLYYVEDFSQKEIRNILCISGARISQIHKGVINKLRRRIVS